MGAVKNWMETIGIRTRGERKRGVQGEFAPFLCSARGIRSLP